MAAPAAAVLIASLLAGSTAVAAAEPEPAAPQPIRLLVKLAQPMGEPTRDAQADVARQATAIAGLPVTFGAAVGNGWLALQMACAPSECGAAVQRLRQAPGLFASVERDERRRHHAP